ncbi:hypothetical protein [Pseudopedobacter beijingensis]|uniref:Uncharacterized protein n=1 Tax=Pseudopedobacter beijingensis TaxID=1207056 RepID=A0ABW4IET3_9SPHI
MTRNFFYLLLFINVFTLTTYAQNMVEYKPKFTEGVALLVTAGDYKIRFAERMSWTFRDITYKGKKVNATSGAQQSVLHEIKTPEGVDKFLGTGHRKEKIESIEVIVLDKKKKVIGVYPVQEGMKITEGDSYIIHKKSKFISEIGGLYYLHDSKITVSNNGVMQDYKFQAVSDDYSNVDFMYVFMHIFPKSTTNWIVGDNKKVIEKGEFLSDKSFTLKKDFQFCLINNPTEQIGIAIIYPEVYEGIGMKNSFWNREYDNKHYLRIAPKKIKGEEFSYSALIKVFETGEERTLFELEGKKIVEKEIGNKINF